MVTHDPVAASYADRVVFLGDGQVVDELADPTPETVLDTMKRLDTLPVDDPGSGPAGDPAGSVAGTGSGRVA
jgi:putative ABC transport system ATP-binding protein